MRVPGRNIILLWTVQGFVSAFGSSSAAFIVDGVVIHEGVAFDHMPGVLMDLAPGATVQGTVIFAGPLPPM
jgi:hypothetical protein